MTFITNVFFFVEPLDNFPVPLEQLAEEIPVPEMFIRQLDERLRLWGSIIKMFEGKQPGCEKVFRMTDGQRQDFIQAHVESPYWDHFYVNDRNIVLYSAVVEYDESQFQIRAARKMSHDGSLDLPIGAPEALLDNEADDLNSLVMEGDTRRILCGGSSTGSCHDGRADESRNQAQARTDMATLILFSG